MVVWFILIFIELIFLIISAFSVNANSKTNDYMCIFIMVCLIALSGFRSLDTGSDTMAYYKLYEMAPTLSWDSFIFCFKSIFLKNNNGIENGYILLEMISKSLGISFNLFLMLVAGIFHVLLYRFIKAFSDEPVFSWIIYTCLLFTFFGLTGLRQTIASIPVLLLGTRYIKDRSFFRFILMIVIGSIFHHSVIVFLPFYWIANSKESKGRIVGSIVVFAIIFLFRSQLIGVITSIIGYEEYGIQYDGAGTYTFTALCLLITIFIAIVYDSYKDYENSKMFTHSMEITLYILPFTFIDPSIMRAAQYYYIFLAFLIPRSFYAFDNKMRRIVMVCSAAVLCILFLLRVPMYAFM